MTKKTRTPEQKLARKLQAQTGRPYAACLAQAKQMLNPKQDGEQP
ncbi:hypothetical protein [Streptomyces sp. 1222.5]